MQDLKNDADGQTHLGDALTHDDMAFERASQASNEQKAREALEQIQAIDAASKAAEVARKNQKETRRGGITLWVAIIGLALGLINGGVALWKTNADAQEKKDRADSEQLLSERRAFTAGRHMVQASLFMSTAMVMQKATESLGVRSRGVVARASVVS